MDIAEAYDQWSEVYDGNVNPTRDLEAKAMRSLLDETSFTNVLEIGCGTGKNSTYFLERPDVLVTGVDLSKQMLAKAEAKVTSERVRFLQADICQADWQTFLPASNGGEAQKPFDLVTFSLVLEHIDSLEDVFAKLKAVVAKQSLVYIGELHPFKQYLGSKARFAVSGVDVSLASAESATVVRCYTHHISDFLSAAQKQGFRLQQLQEHFDEEDTNQSNTTAKGRIPRILSMLFRLDA